MRIKNRQILRNEDEYDMATEPNAGAVVVSLVIKAVTKQIFDFGFSILE